MVWRASFRPAAMVCVLAGSFSAIAGSNHWHPTPVEVMSLPNYCRGQFNKQLIGPAYQIDKSCGVAMNHFCPGLVMMNRISGGARPKNERREMLAQAKIEIAYTRKNMVPGCPLESEVAGAERRLQILGIGLN